ncbi:MAG: LPS-assembly protein LptD [Candidatus Kapabacteria bacterium]|nr:LPS-assembly protein LptD [Candidatus Kapabacteria bacterium]
MTLTGRIFLFGLVGWLCLHAAAAQDTVNIAAQPASSMDTVVVFTARDTAHLKVSDRTLRLRGAARVDMKDQRLESSIIVIDFNSATMKAEGLADSTGALTGMPVFRDAGTEYAGRSMVYNFDTRKGRVEFGETSIDGGYYYGSAIKRVSESTAYVDGGCYTTCNAPHPHFYFTSPKMKVVANEKIFLDPLIWYVDDIPIFMLPLGMYFPIERGRRSGIMIPSPVVTADRGIVLQGLGYYFAISDFVDAEVATDLTTKGGFTLYGRSQYVLKDRLSGNAEVRFGYTRFAVTDPFAMNFGASVRHTQQFRPNESLVADIFFATQRLLQNTSLNPLDRVQQNARSNVSYQRTFYNGMTFNAGYSRDQNMINGSTTHRPTISFGIPQTQPFRSLVAADSWLSEVQLSYRATGTYTASLQRSVDTGAFAMTENSLIEHRPSLTLTPRFGSLIIAPSISYSENWYFQRQTQSIDASDSSLKVRRQSGFFREYTYGVGVNMSTFLYGLAYPKVFGLQAVRHTFQPSIGLSYSPDLSDTTLGFYGSYISPVTGQTITYSRFGTVGGLASRQTQMRVTGSFLNRLAIKTTEGDSVSKPMELFTLTMNTSYNLAADSLRLDPVFFNLRTPMLDALEFNMTGAFNAYDQVLTVDPATGRPSWRDVNTTILEAGKGLARLTSLNLQMGSRFSSDGVSPTRTGRAAADTSSGSDDLRSRFERRVNTEAEQSDIFGDRSPGWSPLAMPWEVSGQIIYSMQRPNPEVTNQSLQAVIRGSISLTPTTRVGISGTVDMLTGELINPIIDVSKQIHCWYLTLNWVPVGFNRGFFLRFGASAAQLRDLVIPKQSTPLFR